VKKLHSRIYPDGHVVHYNKSVKVLERRISGVRVSALEQILDPRFFSLAEREKIRGLVSHGRSVRQIAKELGRAPSSVSRELARNSVGGVYEPYAAHRASVTRRTRPKARKILTQPALQAFVQEGLDNQWSPEQISAALMREYPDSQEMRVSPETIYQTLYLQARGGLKKEIQTALRTGRTRRKPHNTGLERRPRFADPMVMISQRPAEVEDRAVPGHWEGDLIVGTQNRSAIATLVERSTRFVMLAHLPHDHTAETVRDALITTMQTLPEHLRGSLTWDQGIEMARHKEFSIATDMPVYFCDPASPWQRGSNENTNGLLRQYFPKGTDLSVFGPEDLERVALQLNGRPRKTLGWKNPAECLRDLLVSN
jgi:IS30 family transposase